MKEIQVFICCHLKNYGLFGSNHGTIGYALAYIEGRLGKAQTVKDGLYHFLLVFLPKISPQSII